MSDFKAKLSGIHDALITHRRILNGSLYEYVFVASLLFLVTLALTNFTLLSGTHKLFIDGPGDGTAGFLWFNSVDTDMNPVLSHTDMANFPAGENLYNPTQITYSAVLLPLWILSRLLGPILALNLVTFFGFWSCAVFAYWLVRKLTNDPMASFFAAYASAYVPYHLVKSSSHLTYIFSGVFVLILAAFIGYWLRPSAKRAALLAATIALAFYTDGYFLLIGSIFTLCLLFAGIIYDTLRKNFKKRIIGHIRYAAVAVATIVVLLIPVAITQLTQSSKVDSFLTGARGSIAFDIEYYSTHVSDFFIPSPLNPFLKDNEDFQALTAYQNRRSNGSENMTYIGWVIMTLVVVGAVLLLTYLLRLKGSHLERYEHKDTFALVYAVAIVATSVLVLCMLSPSLTLNGAKVVTLGDVLLHFDISLWRVMARFYLPLHIVLVVAASVSLAALVAGLKPRLSALNKKKIRTSLYVTVVTVITLLTAAEYATLSGRPSYDFQNLPKIYSWIKDQDDIKVIAELPMLDRPLLVNYDFATAQIIHGKRLINTPLTSNIPGTRTALGNAKSVEAVNFAIARGADTILTHDEPCQDKPWGRVVHKDDNLPQTRESAYYGSPICAYAVNRSYKIDPLFVKLRYGSFSDVPYIDPKTHKLYQMIYMSDGWLEIVDSNGRQAQGVASLSATIQATPGGKTLTGIWVAYQGEKPIGSGSIPGNIVLEKVDATKPVRIYVVDSTGAAPELFQVSLGDIVVTQLPNL